MKVLVVEDNAVIGCDLVTMLEDWGYHANGPFPSVEKALTAIAVYHPDAAILDIRLNGGNSSEPVAMELRRKGIPFLCLTGSDPALFKDVEAFSGSPHLEKPIGSQTLRRALESLLSTTRDDKGA